MRLTVRRERSRAVLGGRFADRLGEGRHGASHSARIGTAENDSPNDKLVVPS